MRIRFVFEIRVERPRSSAPGEPEFDHRDTEALVEHGDYMPPLESRHMGLTPEEQPRER